MSDYVPTDWVDNVTPVDAARMDHIEAGIDLNRDAVIDHETRIDSIEAGKENKSEKGAVNGYAPLGADTKVPSIYLPAGGGGGGVDYDGAWAAGTPYVSGDVVIHNGVEYLAVNPSTGQTPPSLTPATPAQVPLVTTLPASPFDGQTVDFTDSLLTPSYVWRFRYVAAAPTNKWKFVGGSVISSEVATGEATSSVTAVDLTTPGPSITVPLAGQYRISVDAQINTAAVSGNYGVFMVKLGAAAASDEEGALHSTVAAVQGFSHPAASFVRALAAGDVLKMQYRSGGAGGSVNFTRRHIQVHPIAVSA